MKGFFKEVFPFKGGFVLTPKPGWERGETFGRGPHLLGVVTFFRGELFFGGVKPPGDNFVVFLGHAIFWGGPLSGGKGAS